MQLIDPPVFRGRPQALSAEAALALNAQRDPRTAAAYQSEAVDRALRSQGQDMVNDLLAECWEA